MPSVVDNNLKTPVSLLQELYVKKGVTPRYDLVQIEGAIHEPTFKYRVTVGDLVATGSGQSKKKAKHSAAITILEKISNGQYTSASFASLNPETTTELASTKPLTIPLEALSSPYDDGIEGNPIGALQELCIARRWPPPAYLIASEVGLPHERVFNLTCIVDIYKETGSGKSKKLAKRQAAYKMILTLKDVPEEPAGQGYEDDDELAQKMSGRYSGLKDAKIPTMSQSHNLKISQFHRAMKGASGQLIEALQAMILKEKGFDCVQQLQQIAKEQEFEVNYLDVEERSYSGRYQCLLQLSTLPVAVCYGTGETNEEAQQAAALNALEYLKIMTKK